MPHANSPADPPPAEPPPADPAAGGAFDEPADEPADDAAADPASAAGPAPWPAEAAALQIARQHAAERILCTTLGRGQAAVALASERPQSEVICWFLDRYQQRLAASQAPPLPRLQWICGADFPDPTFDLALVPLSFRGEAELARDLIQDAFARLRIGGQLITAVDNPRDQWLHTQLRAMFPKVTVAHGADAVCYVVRKRGPQRRPRSLRCEFTYRDGPRLLQAVSRPGVFAHRRLDPGARQLIDAVPRDLGELAGDDAPLRILDIGCGSGVVGVALAARRQDQGQPVHVLSLDSNARAVQCTARTATLNGIGSLTAVLESEGDCDLPGSYDLAVANPPYYADFRIAALFLQAAARGLRPGGMLYLVTKHPDWYQEHLFPGWRDATIAPSGRYFIVTARRG